MFVSWKFRQNWKILHMSEYSYHMKFLRVSLLDTLPHEQTVCPVSGILDT